MKSFLFFFPLILLFMSCGKEEDPIVKKETETRIARTCVCTGPDFREEINMPKAKLEDQIAACDAISYDSVVCKLEQ